LADADRGVLRGEQNVTNAAIYVRVSDPKQEKGYSLPTQLDGCRDYAAKHGYSVIGEFVESHTATVLARPQMDKLLDQVEAGGFDTLILYCMDRLSRGGPGHRWYLENEFKRHGVKIEYVTEHYADSPEGDFQKDIQAAVAQFERAKLLERTNRGRRGRAKDGKFIPGGSVRYGYRYVLKTRDDPGHVEIVDSESDVVKLIFKLYTKGDENGKKLGTRSIAAHLTRLGIPTRFDIASRRHKKKRNPCVWGWTSVLSILNYEGYTGLHWFNRSTFVKDENGKQKQIPRDRSEWIAVRIPAIIDRETWEDAQARIHHNKNYERREPKLGYLMRSRLKCAVCGSTFMLDTDSRPKTPKQYYYCQGQKAYFSPDGKTIQCHHSLRTPDVDAAVWAYVRSVLLEPEKITSVFHEKQEQARAELATMERRLSEIERKIAENINSQKVLLDDFLDRSAISRDALEAKAAQLNSMNVDLDAEARSLRARKERKTISDETIASVKEWCERASKGIDLFTFEDKLTVINLLDVAGVVYRSDDPEQYEIEVSGFLPAERLEPGELLNTLTKNTGTQ
jgi:site-specific DNA recombinase